LQHGAAVDSDRSYAQVIRAIEDLEEAVTAFGRIVDSASHLECDRNLRRDGITHAPNDFERDGGLT
jgi:hypothetical protein